MRRVFDFIPMMLMLMLMLGCGVAATAQAGVPSRYALLIGANRGHSGDATLRYAQDDARAMAEVLTKLGDFLPDNVVVLEDPTADRVRDALGRLNARMRTEVAHLDHGFLWVFYSGHGDATAMHMGDSELPWDELRNATVGSSAAVRLLVVDACRSGALTRVKGFTVAAPFDVGIDAAPPEGFALLSSAAAGESAQESDALGGSFFTHHMVAGLRGAADSDQDGSVTLSEAYNYAAARTRASTAQTLAGVQHPTYAYGLRGHADLVVTHLSAAHDWGGIHMSEAGQYLFWRGTANGPLVAEVAAGRRGATIRVPAGTYFVQQRLPHRFYEGDITVTADGVVDMQRGSMREIAYAQYVRKGDAQDASWALSLWSGLTTAPLGLAGYGPAVPLTLSGSANLPQLSVDIAVAGLTSRAAHSPLDARLQGVSLGAGVRKMFDVGTVALGFGARLGATGLWQTFNTSRIAPNRFAWAPHLDTLLRLDWHVASAAFIGLEGGVRVSMFRQAPTSSLKYPVEGIGQLGVGWQW